MSEAAAAGGGQEGAPQDSGPTDVRGTETPRAPDLLRNGQPSPPGISILDRLIKTCPVWLQLCMGAPQVVEILCREASGVFLVTRDVAVKCMVLWVRSSGGSDAADLLRYNIREEKTMMFVEGSLLVFKDIFKLVAFYCISRDILPSILKLPLAISGARSLQDLEEISNLGTGFWDSSLKEKNPSGSSAGNLQSNDVSRELCDCACEIEISAGNGRQWFVTPIFIEECRNAESSAQLPLTNCTAKPGSPLPKTMHRRPPPPPPTLHKPPLPSVPPSAPPPNYIHPHADPSALRSPARPRPPKSERDSPEAPAAEPPPCETSSEPSPSETSAVPPSSETSAEPSLSEISPKPPPAETFSEPPPPETSLESSSEISPKPPLSETSAKLSPPETSPKPPPSKTPCSSPKPPQSLNLQDPKTSKHDLVDLLGDSSVADHPVSSAPSPPPLQTAPSLLSYDLPPVEASPGPSVDVNLKEPSKNMKINISSNDSPQHPGSQTPTPVRAPPAVPKRRPSGKVPESILIVPAMKDEVEALGSLSPAAIKPKTPQSNKVRTSPERQSAIVENGKKLPPVPPPRIKKGASRSVSAVSIKADAKSASETETFPKTPESGKAADRKVSRNKRASAVIPRGSNPTLASSDPTIGTPEGDSYSTSSAEEDSEPATSASIKKSHSFMLDRAKNRLSIVAITNVFTAFMSAERKLQKRIGELAHDKDSYFGNLVQDYKAYSLEMMAKQSSSTEMLQEIRLMMTQLKSYLVQSAELRTMLDAALYPDDKIDAIVEAALCKCVLKPLKSPIECYLREIHNKDGSLRLLTENQQVIQDTTTTDLGVTTSVPDSGVMEKILHKFCTMHKTYSPEKKITYLLKACKLIYDSMAAGNPGKHHGADDFLPVLMYVLAQCDLVALLLDVEYMMELMDPALQLGEGSYYLTTTYGALEHIKNYDKITVTRQLSMEVQDSIHRWERRRTLNKAKVSRSSIQDFITISLEELDSKTRTLATKPDMSVAEVVRQCAEKFEVSAPAAYGLFVQVNERCVRLAEDAFPQQVKSRLLKNEQKLDFHFLYRRTGAQDAVMSELHFL